MILDRLYFYIEKKIEIFKNYNLKYCRYLVNYFIKT